MRFKVKEDQISIGDMRVDHIVFGTGKKNLIMIQGLNTRGIKGFGVPMAYMYRIFARDYTVHFFDRRPNATNDITVREMAADVANAMDILGIKSADVVGVSQGGMIAQYLAIDRPDLVNKLVLAVTLSRNNETVQEVISNWISLTEQRQFKELISDMTDKMYSSEYVKRYKPFLPLLTLMQKPKDIARFINLAKACLTCSAYDELDKIKCPVLVIGGAQDKVTTARASEEIAEKLNCQIHMYEEYGHAAYEEAKDFNERVLNFLNS